VEGGGGHRKLKLKEESGTEGIKTFDATNSTSFNGPGKNRDVNLWKEKGEAQVRARMLKGSWQSTEKIRRGKKHLSKEELEKGIGRKKEQ